MKHLDRLEINELVDLLATYLTRYSNGRKEMASHREVDKNKSIIESLMLEIERRKRATIGPYNHISGDRKDDRMKTA